MSKQQVVIELNHFMILVKKKQATADFVINLLELPAAVPADGPLLNFSLCVQFTNNVMLLIAEAKAHRVIIMHSGSNTTIFKTFRNGSK